MSSAKTTAGELFNRYIWLIEVINEAGKISYNDIRKKWENSSLNDSHSDLPRRTFFAHCRALEEMFGVKISCETSGYYRYYIEDYEDINNDKLRRWVLNNLSLRNLLKESSQLRGKIYVDEIPSGYTFLTTLMKSIKNLKSVKILHHNYQNGTKKESIINPYLLKLHKNRWYVLAYSQAEKEMRLYGLDRIMECETLDQTFTIDPEFDAESYFSDYYGVLVKSTVKLEKVVLKVKDPENKYLRSLPWHHSQKEIETTDEYSIFEFKLRPTTDFVVDLSLKFPDIKVLEPESLKQEVNKVLINKLKEIEGV